MGAVGRRPVVLDHAGSLFCALLFPITLLAVMTAAPEEQEPQSLDELMLAVQQQLLGLRGDLQTVQQQLRSSSPDLDATAGRTLAELTRFIRMALELEKRLAERKPGTTRGGGEDELDLESARRAIGGRLDRLRNTRGAPQVHQ